MTDHDDGSVENDLRKWAHSLASGEDRWDQIASQTALRSKHRRMPNLRILSAAAAVIVLIAGGVVVAANQRSEGIRQGDPGLSGATLALSSTDAADITPSSVPKPTLPSGKPDLDSPPATGEYLSSGMSGGCMNPSQPQSQFPGIIKSTPDRLWITGRAALTGLTELSSDKNVYTELSITVTDVVAGSSSEKTILGYVPGGIYQQKYQTIVDASLETAWASNGDMFAEVFPSSALPGKYEVSGVPLVSGTIAFPGIGCWSTEGDLPVVPKSVSFTFLDSGKPTDRVTEMPTVSLVALVQSLK